MHTILRFLVIAAAFALAACETTSGPIGGGPSRPSGYPAAVWESRPDGRAWTLTAHQAIDTLAPSLLAATPSDIDAFCPGYRATNAAGRRAFYVALLAELARYESNFDPSVRYTESFTDNSGQRVISRGLLQISQESANGYGCAITNAEQLHDPTTNISCAVRIVARWVERDGVIAGYSAGAWRGASRYWSPLRDRNKLVDLQAALNAQSFCARPRTS
jgi:Transglycosylase SLT domain